MMCGQTERRLVLESLRERVERQANTAEPRGGYSPSGWEGPSLLFRVRGEERRTKARGLKGVGFLGRGILQVFLWIQKSSVLFALIKHSFV